MGNAQSLDDFDGRLVIQRRLSRGTPCEYEGCLCWDCGVALTASSHQAWGSVCCFFYTQETSRADTSAQSASASLSTSIPVSGLPMLMYNQSYESGSCTVRTTARVLAFVRTGKALRISCPECFAYCAADEDMNNVRKCCQQLGVQHAGVTLERKVGQGYKGKSLRSGEYLLPGQRLLSSSTACVLRFQDDGEVVVRCRGRVVWRSNTNLVVQERRAGRLCMKASGALVAYDTDGREYWRQGARPQKVLKLLTKGPVAILEDNATLAVGFPGHAVWTSTNGSGAMGNGWKEGVWLQPGEKLEHEDVTIGLREDGLLEFWRGCSPTQGLGGSDDNYILTTRADRLCIDKQGLISYTLGGSEHWKFCGPKEFFMAHCLSFHEKMDAFWH